MVSVLILTLNEEKNLARCLASVTWSDDVVVLDSFSTDQTLDIAKASGVRVFQRKFDNYASHRNWALQNISFANQWVYFCDADEVVTEELQEELLNISSNNSSAAVAYRLRYKNYFRGKWIRHCGIYPVWALRFFQHDKVRFHRLVHTTAEVDGPVGQLKAHFEHYSFNNGMCAWFKKHAQYAEKEAIECFNELKSGSLDWRGLFSIQDPVRRRMALKYLSFRLPLRPLLKFFYMYIMRLGFLDGRQGFTYCCLISVYEYMIVQNLKEMRRQNAC